MRHLFGGSPADYAMEKVGNQLLLRPLSVGTVWDAASGGTQITDLTDLTGTPITTVTADSSAAVAFAGPDGVTNLYVDFGYGRRYAMAAIDLGPVLAAFIATGGDPGGWAQLDGSGLVPSAQLPKQLDWLIVTDPTYGAVGDGVHNDTTAIQAAIDACPEGGIVYFPQGIYKTTATLDLKNGVTLLGSHANLMVGPGMSGSDYACYIQPATPFTGTNVIKIIGDATDGIHPDISGEQRITNLMIDGSQLTGTTIDGLYAVGNVQNVVLDNVCIRQMPNNGIVTASRTDGKCPFSWRLHHVMVDNCHSNGILFVGNTDLTLDDVQVIGCFAQGIVLTNCTNTQLTNCRTEWCGSHGFRITGNWGNWQGSGGMLMSNCSTDRNGGNGVLIDATGATPIQIDNLLTRRDGRNGGAGGGGFAGLNCTAATVPIVIGLVTCYPGIDDTGTGTNSPQYGARFTGCTFVAVAAGFLHAATAGWSDGGGNAVLRRGLNIAERTGTTAAPVDALAPPTDVGGNLNVGGYLAAASGQSGGQWNIWDATAKALNLGSAGGGVAIKEGANARMGVATLVAGTVTVANTSVTATTRVAAFRQAAGGTLGHLSTTKVNGTSLTITSSSNADTSTIAWVLFEAA
ncbi:glycosyl hydrolase family 28-related protein [Streptomyces sp. NBC_01483]|uniref:glycosyl hydrolase family 28-related protein n=1 Tax=Streptomyces sp. NBC_01483 TaxID=2903883 RepID=UPI002E37B2FE|nr:glycosyl hydrolase family 28-related protein [Streptomyces sp. NBC_01483]